jgi:spermidine synthase
MCALTYEIVWMRMFTPIFGLSIYATTTVLCSFMGGLGIGSYMAPSVINRWKKSCWSLYVLLELAIGLGAVLILYSLTPITHIYVSVSELTNFDLLTAFVRFFLALIVMIIPTVFMGLTLPVLIHACSQLSEEDRISTKRIGLLYGFNTLGGAVGCLLVGFLLIYKLGILTTVFITAGLNFLLALCVYIIYVLRSIGDRSDTVRSTEVVEPANKKNSILQNSEPYLMHPVLILLLYGIIGFTSFSYELNWFRILVFYLQSATYSFSIVLIIFLMGIALGSLFYSKYLEKKFHSASVVDALKILGIIQLLIGILGLSTLPLYKYLPVVWQLMVKLLGAETWSMIIFQKSVVAGIIIFPATFLMGIAFPLVARVYKANGSADSKTIGYLYATNTLGAIIGSLVTGFVLFNTIGVQNSLTLASVMSLCVGIIFALKPIREGRNYRILFAGLTAIFIAVFFATPPKMLITNFKKFTGKILFYKESASDITFVFEDKKFGFRCLAFSDGRGTSSTHPIHNYINRVNAYSTMLMNPDAKDVLVICMGCGNTASAFTKFPIERLDIVDLSPGAFDAAKFFFTNQNVLDDPRVHTFIEDGRNYLLKSKKKYDIIELEPPSLHTDGVVNLYTKEFYEIAYSKLKPGGVISQWIDVRQAGMEITLMLVNTMMDVFPQSTVWIIHNRLYVNGVKQSGPVKIDFNKTKSLFSTMPVVKDMQSIKTNYEEIMSTLISYGKPLRQTVGDAKIITDDLTIVDFLIPKRASLTALGGGLAYYTSPLRSIFKQNWKNYDSIQFPERFASSSFYSSDTYQEYVNQSLRQVAQGFPEDVLERIIELSRQ